jgi:K+-sensing histidine kinase KdpD
VRRNSTRPAADVAAGYLMASAWVAAATLALWLLRPRVDRPEASLVYLLAIVLSATTGGVGPAVASAALCFLAWNLFLIGPRFSLSVEHTHDWFMLTVFLLVGLLTGELAGRARDRAAEAEARLREIERLEQERRRLAEEAAAVARLRAADELKTTLLSAVSHDLKTPLASIMASIANLKKRKAASDGQEGDLDTLAAIEEETKRLSALVSDLLDLSRLESGSWRPAREWYDLSDVLGTSLARLDEAAAGRVRIELPDDLPMVRMDGVQIAQVLWNLLDNAVKYSPPDAPVTVHACMSGPELHVAVADCGPGVPAPEQERIFRPFYRAAVPANGSRSLPDAHVPGTGLGLAICRGLVDAHGGRIWVESDGASGARFCFALPAEQPSERIRE